MQLLMRRPEITGFVSIAPPASMYDFAFLAPCPASGLIVHGTRDNFGSIEEMKAALKLIPARTKLLPVESAGHELRTAHHYGDLTNLIASAVASFLE